MNGRGWSHSEERRLLGLIGSPWESILAGLPGRSRAAIHQKLQRLGTRTSQGTWSLNRLQEESGYHRDLFRAARKALRQQWATSQPGGKRHRNGRGRYCITEDQREELLRYLREGRNAPLGTGP